MSFHCQIRLIAACLAITSVGCVPDTADDAGSQSDAGLELPRDDAGQSDAGRIDGDAGSDDAGVVVSPDGGLELDAGRNDSGPQGQDAGEDDGGVGSVDAGESDAGSSDAGAGDGGPDDGGGIPEDGGPLTITVVTFNTGTGTTNGIDDDGDSWTSTEQGIGDEHYGNGLAWVDAINGTRDFFTDLRPDIVAFQEIFHPAECASIAAAFHPGFVCEGWTEGAPTVAQRVLGSDYQVACNLGKPDKCAAVKKTFGRFRGCDADLCLDHLDGVPVPDCGGGSRLGRGTIDLEAGGELTVVTVHGNSGFTSDDADCRIAQVEQVFVDLDGEPAANGSRNIVLGDLNTDPGRATVLDSSAERWTDFVGETEDFHFISDVGFGVAPTYGNSVNIDHVMSDVFAGSCIAPGVTAGLPPVLPTAHFDHTPIICTLIEP